MSGSFGEDQRRLLDGNGYSNGQRPTRSAAAPGADSSGMVFALLHHRPGCSSPQEILGTEESDPSAAVKAARKFAASHDRVRSLIEASRESRVELERDSLQESFCTSVAFHGRHGPSGHRRARPASSVEGARSPSFDQSWRGRDVGHRLARGAKTQQ